MGLMMCHLHAGPAVAARGADTAEVTFLVRGSVSAAAGPGGLTEIQPFETTDLDTSEGGVLNDFSATSSAIAESHCVRPFGAGETNSCRMAQ
jgi:hypothetical protein